MSSVVVFFFQAEDGIRDLVRSRGLGDVYKRQALSEREAGSDAAAMRTRAKADGDDWILNGTKCWICLLYTSDAADERSSVDLGGRRIIKKKNILDTRHSIIRRYKHNI